MTVGRGGCYGDRFGDGQELEPMLSTVKFIPQVRTRIKSVRHINYTCSPERYAELEKLATKSGVTLKELLRQMVDFALKSI